MENNKKVDDNLIDKTNSAINELVYDKIHLVKAYNYYSGIRDKSQFRMFEENYGLGNPTSVTFTPLIRKHIDALIGEFLTLPIKPKVSCKDTKTLNNIFRDKQLAISQAVAKVVKSKLENLIYSLLKGDGQNKINDAQFELELKNVQEQVEDNFISNYEMAAQNIIQYILQDRTIDFKNKLKQLISDLFISGEMYYRVVPSPGGNGFDIKVCNPLHTFPDKNLNSPYINDSYRVVYREYLSLPEIMVRYGESLSKEQIDHLESSEAIYTQTSSNVMLVNAGNARFGALDTLDNSLNIGFGFSPEYSHLTPSHRVALYPVYEVEWIDYKTERGKRVAYRYSTTRIGSETFILRGEDEKFTVRSITSPQECKLSFNGLQYMSRTGQPYSLILATADLQDRYDLLHFFKNNIIAQSGTVGDWLDVAHLPAFLGDEIPDRIQKWLAYKKSAGVAMLDSSQEGAQQMVNTTFAGYDDTVRLQAIQAIDLAIQDIENIAMSITGVFRERIGGIQQRDAVANVEVGMQQSYIVTKQYFHTMDLLIREILLDSLNMCKIVFKKGITGILILGSHQKQLFTALPEHYAVSDFDIHIADSAEVLKEKDHIQALTMELVKGNLVDPELLIHMTTSESLTDLKQNTLRSIRKKKEENNMLMQMQQQLQQQQQAMKEMQDALQKSQKQLEQFNQQQLQLQQDKINKQYEVDKAKVDMQKSLGERKLEYDKKRVELEAFQLIDTDKRNDEVRDK